MGKELTKEFEGSAKFFNCDISSEKEVNLLFEELLHEYGKIDVLVNNAGIIRRQCDLENASGRL